YGAGALAAHNAGRPCDGSRRDAAGLGGNAAGGACLCRNPLHLDRPQALRPAGAVSVPQPSTPPKGQRSWGRFVAILVTFTVLGPIIGIALGLPMIMGDLAEMFREA